MVVDVVCMSTIPQGSRKWTEIRLTAFSTVELLLLAAIIILPISKFTGCQQSLALLGIPQCISPTPVLQSRYFRGSQGRAGVQLFPVLKTTNSEAAAFPFRSTAPGNWVSAPSALHRVKAQLLLWLASMSTIFYSNSCFSTGKKTPKSATSS